MLTDEQTGKGTGQFNRRSDMLPSEIQLHCKRPSSSRDCPLISSSRSILNLRRCLAPSKPFYREYKSPDTSTQSDRYGHRRTLHSRLHRLYFRLVPPRSHLPVDNLFVRPLVNVDLEPPATARCVQYHIQSAGTLLHSMFDQPQGLFNLLLRYYSIIT